MAVSKAGVTRATGDTVLASDWNGFLGAGGMTDYLNDTPGPLTYADFTTAAAPAAPGAGKGRFHVVTGDRPGFRSGLAGAAEQLESQANKNAASGYAGLDAGSLLTGTQVPNTHGVSGVTVHHGASHDHSAAGDGQTIVPVTIGNNGSIAWNGRVLLDKGVDIASAATLTPGTDGNYFHITGTTGITAIASLQAGTIMVFEFDGALTITHNATSLILQGAANLTTAAGDVVAFVSEGAGNWRELFRRLAAAAAASGITRAGGNTTEQTTTSATDVDLVTISGLSIAVGTPVRVVFNFRKSGGAFAMRTGLKLNATVVTDNNLITSNANVAESGVGVWEFVYGRTNYLRSGGISAICYGSALTSSHYGFDTADMPTATLTTIVLRARADGINTFGIQDVQVYTGAVS